MSIYNQKIIETPTYLEIYDYEAIITPKRKKDKIEIDNLRKEKLPWLYNDENLSFEHKNKNIGTSAQEQYSSLQRRKKHYKNMRFEIARLVDTNFDNQTKFMTLTFKENVQDIEYSNNEFKKFVKRLNYHLYKTKIARLKYLATWEKQKRGAIHFHIIFFHFPFISINCLTTIWGHGFVKINKIDVDSIENRGRYVSKYFDKELDLKEMNKKAFFKSRNLKLPAITKKLVDKPFDAKEQNVLYSKEYLVKRPIFYNVLSEDGSIKQEMNFQERTVRYIKIRK